MFADLAGESFTNYHMRDDSLIFTGCAVKRPKENPARFKVTPVPANTPPLEAPEQKGDLLIHDLWQNGTNSVHGRRVVNTYAKSHLTKTPAKCLKVSYQDKKKIYLEACLQQRQHFHPFVASVDGLLGVEVTATLKRIARHLENKWWRPYSRTCEYVKSKVAIT